MATNETKKIVRSAEAIARSNAIKAIKVERAKAMGKSIAQYDEFLVLADQARSIKADIKAHVTAFDAKFPHASKSKNIVKSATLAEAIAANDTATIQKILAKMAEREIKVAANLKKMAADRKAKKASEVKTVAA